MTLKEKLISESKNRWLDIGSGKNPDLEFELADIVDLPVIHKVKFPKFTKLDIVRASDDNLKEMGKFDLVRMQHVFEHLTAEDGQTALKNCAKLLNDGGILLITTPDLKKNVQAYLADDGKVWTEGYRGWARKRVPKDAPNSFYFSLFAHSTLDEPHLWCYDADGLLFQLKRSKCFSQIRVLPLDDPLSEVPFTHNRPNEDVCVIAIK